MNILLDCAICIYSNIYWFEGVGRLLIRTHQSFVDTLVAWKQDISKTKSRESHTHTVSTGTGIKRNQLRKVAATNEKLHTHTHKQWNESNETVCDHRRPEIRDHYQHKIGRSLWFEEWKRKRDIVWKRRENVKKKGKKDFFSGEKKSGRAKKSARAHYTARSLLMKLTWRSENIIYVRCLLLKLNSF